MTGDAVDDVAAVAGEQDVRGREGAEEKRRDWGPRALTWVASVAQTGIVAFRDGVQFGWAKVRPIPTASGVWEPSHWAIQRVGAVIGLGEVSVVVDADMVSMEVGEAVGCGRRACRILARGHTR